MLQQLAPSLWVNDVPFKLLGIDLGNRMTAIRLSDNRLWLHSPTRFDQAAHNAISELGDTAFLVTPNRMHNLFVMDWKAQSPNAKLLAPSKTKKVQADILLDEIPSNAIHQLFNNEITAIPIKGIPVLKEFAFIHHDSRTLILTDIAFNFANDSRGWKKLFLKLYGAYNKFGPTISIRSLIKDKPAFGVSLEKILEHDFDRIIVSHGEVIHHNGKAAFEKAFKKQLTAT